jgi:hypothetical protein
MSRLRPAVRRIVAPGPGRLCGLGLAAALIAGAASGPAPAATGRPVHGVDLVPFTEVAARSPPLRRAGVTVVD